MICSFLGSGGWGRVYEVEHVELKSRLALKMPHATYALDRDKFLRFRQEAQALISVDHPNVARVFDFVRGPDGQPCLIMELLVGTSLEKEIQQSAPIAVDDAVEIAIQTCEGLSAVHSKGIVHRDVKPANIWFKRYETGALKVKVLDFGLAKIKSADEASLHLTATGDSLGTPAYMSPEQCRGYKLDQKTDIYSLGCVLYEAITGKKAFSGASVLEILTKHITGDPQPLTEANPALKCQDLQAIITRALAREPKDRYQTMAELLSDLKKVKQRIPVSIPHSAHKTISWKLSYALIACTIFLVACLITYNIRSSQEPAPTNPEPTLSPSLITQPQRIEKWLGKDLAQYNAAIDHDPNNADLYYQRGVLYELREERPNAIADFSKSIELDPNKVQAYIQRAVTYGHMSEFDKAMSDAALAVHLSPNWDWVYMERAEIENDAELYQAAIDDATRAIEHDSRSAFSYTRMAMAYDSIGRHEKAIEIISKAKSTKYASWSEYAAAGLFYMHQRNFEHALKDLQHASVSRTWSDPWARMAISYAAQGDMAAAELASAKALAVDTHPGHGYRLRGDMYQQGGNFEKAIENYSLSISFDPKFARSFRKRAICYLQIGQLRNSVSDLQEAVKLNPRSAASLSYLARVEDALGQTDQASKDLKRALSTSTPTAQCYVNRAIVLLNHGQLAKAIADCQTAIGIDPQLAEAYYVLSTVCDRQNDRAGAVSNSQKATKLGYPGATPDSGV